MIEYDFEWALFYMDNNTVDVIEYIPKKLFQMANTNALQILYMNISNEGRTLLHLLTRMSKCRSICMLTSRFPNINFDVETLIGQWRPIHNAIYMRYSNIVRHLIEHGVNNDCNIIYNETVITDLVSFCDICQPCPEDLRDGLVRDIIYIRAQLITNPQLEYEKQPICVNEMQKIDKELYFELYNIGDNIYQNINQGMDIINIIGVK